MKYLRVKNWEKLRHQEDASLPWVKLFTALLSPTKSTAYSDWPDHTKALLLHVWLMARVHNNRIPEIWLTRERLNLQTKLNLKPLLAAGFVWFEDEEGTVILDSSLDKTLDSSLERNLELGGGASLEKSLDSDKDSLLDSSIASSKAFESIWNLYPSKDGKKASEKHFRAGVRTRADLVAINQALRNYLRHLELHVDWKKPKNGSTWFNNWRDWVDWKEPDARAVEPEPEPVARVWRVRQMADRDVASFIDAHGDPDFDAAARQKFTLRFRSMFELDDGDIDHWAKFLRVCAEEGVNPKPAHIRA